MRWADSSENTFCCQKDFAAQIVSTHALWVGHTVDLAEDGDELRSFLRVFCRVDHDASARLLLLLDLCQVLICLDGLRDVTSRISLNKHKFEHVYLLVVDPGLIEIVQVLGHILDHVLHRDVCGVLNYALIQVTNDVLNDAELLEELAPGVQHLVRENILLSVDPQVGEAFLGRVEDLCQVAKTAFLVEHFVGLGELFAVGARCAVSLEHLAEALNLIEESLACALAILAVEVVLFVRTLLQVIAHHHCVLEEQEVGTSAELLNFCQWTRWRCLRSNRNQLREFKVILADVVHILSVVARFPK